MIAKLNVRPADADDLKHILYIYNQGIEDRIATLEENPKDMDFMRNWFENDHNDRYIVIVAEYNEEIIGWASLNSYSSRSAYDGVADLSIYIKRSYRGKGVGSYLLKELERAAINNKFNKIVLFTFPFNEVGQGLYRKNGYREVGIFKNQGKLDGRFVDVMIMEKILIQG